MLTNAMKALKMKLPTDSLNTLLTGLILLCVCSIAQAADTTKGQQLYATNCAICHGQTGTSMMPGAPDLNRGDNLLRPDVTLLESIRLGKNAMPAFQGIMSDAEMMDVIAYLRTMH